MEKQRSAERDFNQAADRRSGEREILIRQLVEKDQQHVADIRKQHEHDVLERRQLQGAMRMEEIKEQRQRLVQEHAQPALKPAHQPARQRNATDIERLAAKEVDDRNRSEITGMANNRDTQIDQFLNEKGQSYDQFKDQRQQLERQQAMTKENNGITRQI